MAKNPAQTNGWLKSYSPKTAQKGKMVFLIFWPLLFNCLLVWAAVFPHYSCAVLKINPKIFEHIEKLKNYNGDFMTQHQRLRGVLRNKIGGDFSKRNYGEVDFFIEVKQGLRPFHGKWGRQTFSWDNCGRDILWVQNPINSTYVPHKFWLILYSFLNNNLLCLYIWYKMC